MKKKQPAVVSVDCECGASIRYLQGEPPRRCVCCGIEFVRADKAAVLDESGSRPTVVRPTPVQGTLKSK